MKQCYRIAVWHGSRLNDARFGVGNVAVGIL